MSTATPTPPPPPHLKFEKLRSLEEIEAECRRRGWQYSDRLFQQGNDCVSFQWKIGNVSGNCVLNTFNGRFMGETKGGIWYTSNEGTHEGKAWFKTLLNVCYVPLQASKKGGK